MAEKINKTPLRLTVCNCGGRIAWMKTWRGKNMPVDVPENEDHFGPYSFSTLSGDDGKKILTETGSVETVGVYKLHVKGWISHFSTCLHADRFRSPS